MSAPRTQQIAFTTDASGDAVVTAQSERGALVGIVYEPDDTDTPAAGTTLKVEGVQTDRVVLNAVNVGATRKEYSPRFPTHDPDGTVIEHEATASPVSEPMRLANEQLKLTVASGGNAKKGVVTLLFE